MLAKVIRLRNERGGHVSVTKLVDYLSRDLDGQALTDYVARDGVSGNDAVQGGTLNLEGLAVAGVDDRALITQMMDYVSEAGRCKTHFKTNPLYHFALSWPDGECPDGKQAAAAVAHAVKALGMEENQGFFVIHRDKEHHHHIHVVINRVHPERHVLTGPPRYDYIVLDKACREIELAHGWQHDHGPHVVIDGDIRRLSKAQRKAMGLVGAATKDYAQTPGSRMAEIHGGVPSFADWMRTRVVPEIVNQTSWQGIHEALAQRGIRLEQRGGGLVFVTLAQDRETSTKASGIDYRLSRGRLEKTLGHYQPSARQIEPTAAKTYASFAHNVRSGREPGEYPGRTGSSPEREKRRMERSDSRDALTVAYAAEKQTARTVRQANRAALNDRQRQERGGLLGQMRDIKQQRMSEIETQYGSKAIAKGLWAAEKAAAVEALQAKHQIEKADFVKAHAMEWPVWLDRRAAAGDPAAISALRGIRYRDQRKKTKERPGFEGEDLEDGLTPKGAPTAQSGGKGGSISGEVRFSLSTARIEVDQAHQRIIYSDQDGIDRLIDTGPRVDVLKSEDRDTIRAGLILASQKFGGEVYITGSQEFRERAAKEAAAMGVRIADQDLRHTRDQDRPIDIER